MVDDEKSPGLHGVSEILKAFLVVPLVPVEVWQVGEGVSHADDGIKSPWRRHDVGLQSQPVGLLDDPVVKHRLLPPLPPGLVGSLQHLVRGVRGRHLEAFLQQHHGVHPGPAGRVQDVPHPLLPHDVDEELLVVLSAGGLITCRDKESQY